MTDSNEIVRPAAEAVAPSVHPDVSSHVKTEGDIKHLAEIHAALKEHGVTTTGDLTPVSTEPQSLDSSQFETKSKTTVQATRAQLPSQLDDPSTWNSIFMRKQQERRKRAA